MELSFAKLVTVSFAEGCSNHGFSRSPVREAMVTLQACERFNKTIASSSIMVTEHAKASETFRQMDT